MLMKVGPPGPTFQLDSVHVKLLPEKMGRPPKNESEKSPAELRDFPRGTETRDIAAKKAGFASATILRYAEAVHDKGSPELKEAVA